MSKIMINEAKKMADRSTNRKHKTGCVIVNSLGDIVSNGWSHVGLWNQDKLYSTHSEIHALNRARNKRQDLEGCTIFIATIARKSGRITSAAPCYTCATALVAAGVNMAVYTIPQTYHLTFDAMREGEMIFSPDVTTWGEMYIPDKMHSLKTYSKTD